MENVKLQVYLTFCRITVSKSTKFNYIHHYAIFLTNGQVTELLELIVTNNPALPHYQDILRVTYL